MLNYSRFLLLFVGITTNDEWNMKIKHNPAPWGELIIPGFLIITFPSVKMRRIENMEKVGQFYAKCKEYFLELMGISKLQTEERVVFDKQTFGGNLRSFSLRSF